MTQALVPTDIERARSAPAPLEAVVEADELAPGRARYALAGLAREAVGAGRLNDVLVAVSEAVTNAVHHAYGAESGMIRIKAWSHGDALGVLVVDEGRGVDVPALFAPRAGDATETPPRAHRLGMHLMRTLASDFRLASPPGAGTSVLLVFRPARRT